MFRCYRVNTRLKSLSTKQPVAARSSLTAPSSSPHLVRLYNYSEAFFKVPPPTLWNLTMRALTGVSASPELSKSNAPHFLYEVDE